MARLKRQLRTAQDRQTASAEILRTIGSVSGDAERSLYQIAETTKRLFEAFSVSIFVAQGDEWGQIVHDGASSQRIGAGVPVAQLRIGGHSLPGAAFSENRQIHLPDIDNVDPAIADWPGLRPARAAGTRTLSGTPLRRAGQAIGVLIVHRNRLAPFAADELTLLQTFADQAAIAIENARLFNETREALERETATAEILEIINSTPGNLAPVFEAILEKAMLLCGASFGALSIYQGDDMHQVVATRGMPSEFANLFEGRTVRLGPETGMGRLVRGENFVHIADASDDEGYRLGNPLRRALVDIAGARTYLGVPLRTGEAMLGSFTIYRREVRLFSEKQIALLQNFAAQAVTAIENARLFNETREALERQTATADILKVIASSPDDVQPVFEAIAERSNRLIDGLSTAVYSIVDDTMHLKAFTRSSPEADAALQAAFPRPLSEVTFGDRIRHGEIVQIPDMELSVEWEVPALRSMAQLRGFRAVLFVPLLRDRVAIGLISITRKEPGAFAAHHVELLQTFADQAVIAIGNVRLFDEVQAKTADLSEALTYQTGSSNILRVIASSPTDVGPVLKAIVESACELCDAVDAIVLLNDVDSLRTSAHHGPIPLDMERWPISRKWVAGRAFLDRKPVHVHDLLSAEGEEFPDTRQRTARTGTRSILSVPLLRDGKSIGTIVLRRTEVHPFSDKQIALLQTFADQAVIAIGNVRLFDEVQAKTRDLSDALMYQTGSSNILKVIASSPTDVGPVLRAIAESACELCEAVDASVFLRDGNHLAFSGHHGPLLIPDDRMPINRGWVAGRAFLDQKPVHVEDLRSDDGEFPEGRQLAEKHGHRTTLGVPLLSDNESIGAIVVRRMEVRPFTVEQIELIRTFADQAVIAIGNVHLFEQVQQRTRELSQSLDDLRTAQDRLIQTEKLASLGQLTAGIAHEIKNPLNFVNNFSALSAELVGEMNDVLAGAALDKKTRGELDDLAQTLKSNLEKVVQHGKRADSIVKNMLLHSREGSGEQRAADINALLDESLNLAYHGARAEKPGFNITLQCDFDTSAGAIELFPQEMTRAFLNLISNGFYAASKRMTDNRDPDFEPVLSAATKNLGNHVEIRIRDNGTGIPPEVKEKIFNPFFTTKPAGEGTGLGLSMSHDIIVKQHGGTIDVETEPGLFTEFKIVLPRASRR